MDTKVRALVTGSNGFIGSHLVEYLLTRDYRVSCLVRETSNLRWIEDLDVTFVYGDNRDKQSLERAVRDHDYVFHLAGKIKAPDWDAYYEANYVGTRNVIEACIARSPDLKRFIYISSISAAGPTATARVQTEEDECRPVSDYGRTKLLGEEAVAEHMSEIPCVIIRPANILGPREENLYSVFKIIKRRILPLLGNGDKQTSICFVEDLVRGIEMAATGEKTIGKTYYLTDGQAYSWREIAGAIARHLGIDGFLVPVPHPVLIAAASIMETAAFITRTQPLISRTQLKELRDSYWIYDGSKAERDFGFTTRVDIEDGIKRSIDWYRERSWL